MKRGKRRYLALRIETDCVPGEREFLDSVWSVVTRLFGEYGASLTGLALTSYDRDGKFAILRVNLNAVDSVRASLATMTSLCGREAAIHIVGISGTIRSLHDGLQK